MRLNKLIERREKRDYVREYSEMSFVLRIWQTRQLQVCGEVEPVLQVPLVLLVLKVLLTMDVHIAELAAFTNQSMTIKSLTITITTIIAHLGEMLHMSLCAVGENSPCGPASVPSRDPSRRTAVSYNC